MRSFDKLNYAIRPKKHIERTLVFSALQTLEPYLPISKYRYVGMGSMWFKDFILAHRSLNIQTLLSIEEDAEDAKRAEYNKPFECIKVRDGHSSTLLSQIELGSQRAILWLDYETSLVPWVLTDLGTVCGSIPNGSIVLVTLNASAPGKDSGEKEALFRTVAGDLVPQDLSKTFFDGVPTDFPNNLAQMVIAHFAACLMNAGRSERPWPLFNFYYRDGAPMITVGVVIAESVARDQLEKWQKERPFAWVRGNEQFVIDAPNLTSREKLLFDQLLPQAPAALSATLAQMKVPFSADLVSRYGQFYLQYPLFGELLP